MTTTNTASNDEMARRHRRVAVRAGSVAVVMLAMAFAAVPLYQMFCQVTGFGGTTRRVVKPSDVVIDRTVAVRFDASVAAGLGWTFEPVKRVVDVKLGETTVAVYRATNTSTVPITGTASFNVTPEVAGAFFNKIECFCFTEQTLAPGQSVDMPVTFYVDPTLATDRNSRRVEEITLSYTYYPTTPTVKGKGS